MLLYKCFVTFFLLIRVTDLVIYANSVVVKKYFLWGLLPIRYSFQKTDSVRIVRVGGNINSIEEISVPTVSSATIEAGCLLSILQLFFPYKIVRTSIQLISLDLDDKIVKRTTFMVNGKELEYLKMLFHPTSLNKQE